MAKAVAESEFSPNALANAIGVAAPTVSAWIGAAGVIPAKNITGDNMLKACEKLKIRPEWLLYRRGPMRPDSQENSSVNSRITTAEGALSLESARQERARLLAETLLDVSNEMRGLIDTLVQADHEGGAAREMTIAGVGYILQSVPLAHTQKKVK